MSTRPVRTRRPRRRCNFRPAIAALEARAMPAPINVLVNNPAMDLTRAQDTQSESSALAYTNAAGQSIVIDAYNDSGSNAISSSKFTGWSRSIDGGMTFNDRGTLPTSANGDGGDPVLARDAVGGRVYLATLSMGNAINVF